jgi:succinate dehydrogenase/fumarate reductase flavoprotein subunit
MLAIDSSPAFRTELQKTMQNNAAVFRTGEVLEEGCEIT